MIDKTKQTNAQLNEAIDILQSIDTSRLTFSQLTRAYTHALSHIECTKDLAREIIEKHLRREYPTKYIQESVLNLVEELEKKANDIKSQTLLFKAITQYTKNK